MQDGEIITKLLTETLIDLGLKLNTQKTESTRNIIRDSIKPDKLFWIAQNHNKKNSQSNPAEKASENTEMRENLSLRMAQMLGSQTQRVLL
jgi:hypothetical protein